MQILFYDANGHDRTLTAKELAGAKITTDTLLWVNASKAQIVKAKLPKELAAAIGEARFDDLTVRVYDTFYAFAVPVAADNPAPAAPVNMFVGENWLITLGEGDAVDFTDFISHDVGETMKGKLSGSTLAAALLSDYFGRIHHRVSMIDREVDRVEERVLVTREGRNTLQVMAVMRRQVSRLRHVLADYRPVIHALTRPDFLPELTDDDTKHFRYLQAGYERLEDDVNRVREAVVGSFDLYSTRIALDTNRLIRTLTFFTIGIGLVGAVAGVFGMNFQVEMFEQGQAPFAVVAVIMGLIMAITSGIALYTYRKP